MAIRIGNAPCSWGVEFAGEPRIPPWKRVLSECKQAGFNGIELGPVGYLPEDTAALSAGLEEAELEQIGGVVFRPFQDATAWDEVLDGAAEQDCDPAGKTSPIDDNTQNGSNLKSIGF